MTLDPLDPTNDPIIEVDRTFGGPMPTVHYISRETLSVEIVEVFSYILVEESLCTYGFSPACWRGVRPISTKCPVSKSTWVLLNLRRLIVTWGSIFHIRRERLLWRDKYFHPWTGRGLLGCFGVWMDYLWKWMNYLLGIRICYLFFYSGFFLDLPRESSADSDRSYVKGWIVSFVNDCSFIPFWIFDWSHKLQK